jgi:hypothetical protein
MGAETEPIRADTKLDIGGNQAEKSGEQSGELNTN